MVRVVVVRSQNFLKSSRALYWYERKIFLVQPRVVVLRVVLVRVVVVRTHNFLSPAACCEAKYGSVARGSGTNAKLSMSSCAW